VLVIVDVSIGYGQRVFVLISTAYSHSDSARCAKGVGSTDSQPRGKYVPVTIDIGRKMRSLINTVLRALHTVYAISLKLAEPIQQRPLQLALMSVEEMY